MRSRKILVAALAIAISATSFTSCKKVSTKKLKGDWTVSKIEVSGTDKYTYTNNTADTWKNETTSTMSFDGAAWSMSEVDTDTDDNNNIDKTTTEANASAGTLITTNTYNGTETFKSEGEYSNEATMTYSFAKEGTFTFTSTESKTEVFTSEPDTTLDYTNFPDVDTLITIVKTTKVTDQEENRNGEWSFMGKNKDADIKTNERIALTYIAGDISETVTETEVTTSTKIDEGISTNTVETTVDKQESSTDITYTSNGVDELWKITDISKDAISAEITIVSASEQSTSTSNTNTYTDPSNVNTTTTSSSTSESSMIGTIELTQN